LERSGVFRSIDVVGAPATDETTGLQDPSFWRKKGADALVSGSVTRLPDGRMDVRFRLWDVARNENMGGVGYSVAPSDMRMAAHKIADYVYEKLTGEKAVFSTRIAYVTKNGTVYIGVTLLNILEYFRHHFQLAAQLIVFMLHLVDLAYQFLFSRRWENRVQYRK
jgi:Tol biopolymer transport system component